MQATTIPPARRRPKASKSAIAICRDEVSLIGDYLTDGLTITERLAFEAHLGACQDCAAFLATYKKTIELTRSFLRGQSTRHTAGSAPLPR